MTRLVWHTHTKSMGSGKEMESISAKVAHCRQRHKKTISVRAVLGWLRRGLSPEKAAEIVYRYHHDYQDIPRWFSGTWARRFAAFQHMVNEEYTAFNLNT